MMKRFFSFALAIMMVAAMSVTAFADETGVGAGSYTIPVAGTYQAGTAAGEVISVDISWGDMEFTYTAGDETWDAVTHKVTTADGIWSETGNSIAVKNHSNTGVNAKFDFTAADGLTLTHEFKNGLATVGDNGINIESANDSAYQTAVDGVYPAPTAQVDFYIRSGAITQNVNSLGNITVTIAKAAN